MDMSNVLYRFYAAGYNGKHYPIDLRKVASRGDRRAARKAHADGIQFRRREAISARRLRGFYGPLDAEATQMFRTLYPARLYPQFYKR